MDVSVIIVSYNTLTLTSNCLNSLIEKTNGVDYEIFVVDNNSADDSAEMIENEFPKVKLIKNYTNIGFGRANNLAIEKSDAKYVFLLNSDTVLVNNAVKLLFNNMELEENANVACCGGVLYNQDMTNQISYGRFPTIKALFFYYFLEKIFPKKYYNNYFMAGFVKDEIPINVDYVTGADMLIRKTVLDKVGGFDNDFFLYFEETELCSRFIKNGFVNKIFPTAKIIHLCGMSPLNEEKENIFFKSMYIYLEKHKGLLYATVYKFISGLFSSIAKIIKTITGK